MRLTILTLILCWSVSIITVIEGQTVPTVDFTVTPSTAYPLGSAPDTAGVAFRYAFTTNAHRAFPKISFDIVAQDPIATRELRVQITFAHNGRTTEFRTASSRGRFDISPNDTIVWPYLNHGLSKQINNVIYINSTGLIRLYAVNQDSVTGQMDITTVLPLTMASTHFVVTLPVASPKIDDTSQAQLLLFVPASSDSYVNNMITVQMENSKVKEPPMMMTYNGTKYLYYVAWSREISSLQQTFYVTSTKPILVVAAVTCAPVYTNTRGNCDYASYMPPPAYFQNCPVYSYDLIATDGINAVDYFLSPPVWKDCDNGINGINSQYIYYQDSEQTTKLINSKGPQAPLQMKTNGSIAFRSDSALIQVTRLGGVDIVGHATGAFLTHVPNIGSLIDGLQYFFISSTDTHIEVVADNAGPVIVDGMSCNSHSSMSMPTPLGKWYYFLCDSGTNVSNVHWIYTPGKYMATVIGHGPSTAFGFEIAFNKPQPGPQYQISTTTSTTSTSTTTTTTTTSSTTTNAFTTTATTPSQNITSTSTMVPPNNTTTPPTTPTTTTTTTTTTKAPTKDTSGVSAATISLGLIVVAFLTLM